MNALGKGGGKKREENEEGEGEGVRRIPVVRRHLLDLY